MDPARFAVGLVVLPLVYQVVLGAFFCNVWLDHPSYKPLAGLAVLHALLGAYSGYLAFQSGAGSEEEFWDRSRNRFLWGIIGTCLFFFTLTTNEVRNGGFKEGFVAVFVVLFLYGGWYLGKWLITGGNDNEDEFVRGTELFTLAKLQRSHRAQLNANADGYFWGGAMLPEKAATNHFLVMGATGSGKTLTLTRLMRDAFTGMSARDCRALVYDPKTEFISLLDKMGLGVDVKTLNPFDARGVAWDIAKDFAEPRHIEALAAIMTPDVDNPNLSQPFYPQVTRRIIDATIKVFHFTTPGVWTLRDVVLAATNIQALRVLLGRHHTGQSVKANYLDADDKQTTSNIMASMDAQLAPFHTLAAAWHTASEAVSLNDWLASNYILVLPNDPSSRPTINAMNQLIFNRIVELVLAQPNSDTRRTWFFLDELSDAGKLDKLQALSKLGRSRGACCALGFQSIEGLQEVYGEKVAGEIADQCANKALLKVTGDVPAKWASDMIGSQEVWVESYSTNRNAGLIDILSGNNMSTNRQKQTRAAVLPSEFQRIPDTNLQNGLSGFYISGQFPPFSSSLKLSEFIPREQLNGTGMNSASIAKDYEQREVHHQVLQPWDVEDLRRLNLPAEILSGAAVASQPPKPAAMPSAGHENASTPKFAARVKRRRT